jgi:HlyD family secretion protein
MDKIKHILIIAGVVLACFILWKWKVSGPFRYAGTVEATEVDLSARVASSVAQYLVKEGDPVDAGQTLVTLSCEDMKLARDSAASDFERAQKLYKGGTLPFEAYDHIRVKRDDTAMRASWCTVKSPVKGTILDVYHEAAEWVTPGVKLLTVGDLSAPVTGTLPELKGREFEGRVTHIASEAEFTPKNVQTRKERTRLVYGVKVTFPNPDGTLKPGMTLEAGLPD